MFSKYQWLIADMIFFCYTFQYFPFKVFTQCGQIPPEPWNEIDPLKHSWKPLEWKSTFCWFLTKIFHFMLLNFFTSVRGLSDMIYIWLGSATWLVAGGCFAFVSFSVPHSVLFCVKCCMSFCGPSPSKIANDEIASTWNLISVE